MVHQRLKCFCPGTTGVFVEPYTSCTGDNCYDSLIIGYIKENLRSVNYVISLLALPRYLSSDRIATPVYFSVAMICILLDPIPVLMKASCEDITSFLIS
jgi:hypothetical protein